jgi:hypothetical protein
MKPILIIDTFNSVVINDTSKPIVICDIDHTFIRPIEYINNIFEMSIKLGKVKQTDEKGFLSMLEKVQNLGGKLIFLTARSRLGHLKTLNDLTKAGLVNPDTYEIHYTANQLTKGEYIRKYNLLEGYDQFIFIDDYPFFLESALRIYPTMDCYLFKYHK